ncbi:DUF2914 domain-containing protein [Pseudoalteromonas luteoviolacea]|uniref:DUF2914 domain-containing protein n=1 Tax=Pseudoalteromonas luteoviolacea DSM 6061 TaxID=1365250 RepID=A0A166XEA7_9GAMM|nr:DUF2914 domain-containing protein [Pseudoalteromonas luteoviolacea]KZN40227.1 hypothetical protein N475_12225 [Pseudoalteromonas luteoviolacea DSM 6061]KZN57202.1 hypothetical protein N474_08350 [Pseudoalteromonas luteoviolacea CPMOR-2]MBE0387995.1 hypothetical protein [Pseudoalteromonas luteoviolacea DSM 6061]TQF72699.1 DUF2914 domain-containing protein [Pseudoalteromonas luteoviolacea]
MTQRIVIKTKVTDAQSQPATANSVSYQYHWRRIITVLVMMSFGVMALSYGVFKSVYADDSTTVNSDAVVLAASVANNPVTPATERPSVPQIQDNQALNSEVNDIELTTQDEQVVAEAEPELSSVVVVNVADDADSLLIVASNDTEEANVQPELPAQPEFQESPATTTRFADDAQIASVALNAKVDTSHISRAVLTSGIENREPVNVLKHLVEQNRFEEKLYFFTEIKGLQGEVVQHLWFHQEQLMAEITLSISAPRFRTYSSKNIMPSQTGQWRVEVITQNGQLLAQKSFRILAKAP